MASLSKDGLIGVILYFDYTNQSRPVVPSIQPGYLQEILTTDVPEQPQNWMIVMEDFLQKVLPGITHWQSNNFHAYFLSQASYPSE